VRISAIVNSDFGSHRKSFTINPKRPFTIRRNQRSRSSEITASARLFARAAVLEAADHDTSIRFCSPVADSVRDWCVILLAMVPPTG
jgi:hypothetical protein